MRSALMIALAVSWGVAGCAATPPTGEAGGLRAAPYVNHGPGHHLLDSHYRYRGPEVRYADPRRGDRRVVHRWTRRGGSGPAVLMVETAGDCFYSEEWVFMRDGRVSRWESWRNTSTHPAACEVEHWEAEVMVGNGACTRLTTRERTPDRPRLADKSAWDRDGCSADQLQRAAQRLRKTAS